MDASAASVIFGGEQIPLLTPCHVSVNSKGLFIVRTRLPPRVYSLSPKSSKYKDVHRPSGVTV